MKAEVDEQSTDGQFEVTEEKIKQSRLDSVLQVSLMLNCVPGVEDAEEVKNVRGMKM